jgi:hypothetical protein
MSMNKLFGLIIGVGLLASCSHQQVTHGNVDMKVSETEAHVKLKEANVGDKVTLIKEQCHDSGRETTRTSCRRVPAGYGEVTSVLNDKYSVVKFADGISFREGDEVERRNY